MSTALLLKNLQANDAENVQWFCDSMENCRMFVTEEGEIGIAPHNAREGDVVCVVKGALAPCILRQIPQDQWSLVSGDTYMCNHAIFTYGGTDETEEKRVRYYDTMAGDAEEDFIIY
jgi:hypothetical protein